MPEASLLASVLDAAPTATAFLDRDGIIAYANRAFDALLGAAEGATRGTPYAALIAEAGDGQPQAAAASARRRYRRRDGSEIWVQERVAQTGEGAAASVIFTATDIDAEVRREEALVARESRWNYALEGAKQGVWDSDTRNGTRFYSRMWWIMRGFDPDRDTDKEAAIANWVDRVHPDDRERVLAIIARQDSGELAFNAFDYRERHRDGHWIWILSRGKTIDWFDDGKPARVIGTDTDITGLKEVEAQLAAEKERLRVTLSSIGDGVITTDAEGRVTFINHAAEQLTGWRPAEAVGQVVKDVFQIVAEGSGRRVGNPVAESLARGTTFRLDQDVVLVARSGERRSIRETAAPVRGSDGAVHGAILVFQDVSASRSLQRQLAHSAAHDGLTGLPNRSAFEKALNEAVAQARRENRQHALCFIDLDRFKQVNDGAGHAAGDALLQRIGEVIRQSCRSEDFAGRIGGDEFVLLLADCPLENAKAICEDLVSAIAAVRYFWEGVFYDVGASVGITAIDRESREPRYLLEQADAACYTAKAAGRDCVRIYAGEQLGPRNLAKSA